MLSIRLKRIGKKHQAAYRVVVSERRHKMVGVHTEDLGWYNPGQDKGEFKIDRIKYWMSVGASVSDTIHNLLLKRGLITGKKIAKHKQPKKDPNAKVATATEPAAAPAAATPTEKPAETK
ncbi:MAG: 30S ribosomal protein S16 [bacterium]|nr:30S ribosomal protein S16 [bacterium]